ncbi:hypothetical protein AB0O52_20560 [Arthrobacter sp. NPDC080073]|uniref:PGN_0703 family putative restriction endonuclease n=1 Tax=Arthrobacter sp. NPDC080073 TaxID=3155919 RepID=UPI0034250F80
MPRSDTKFMRRVRSHQAWYRLLVLELEQFGFLAGSGAQCGSVLADADADRGLNFISASALMSYEERRTSGWGVDPIRCTKYLTSSQTLTFNMISDAVQQPERAALLFGQLLGRSDLVRLESADFEFTGFQTPYWLGDRTFVDMLLRFRRQDGGLQVVAVETKLADRFSTRRTDAMGGLTYQRLSDGLRIWRDLAASLESNLTRQLTRCHALAQSVQLLDGGAADEPASLLVLLHPNDINGRSQAETYFAGLVEGEGAVVTWDAYLSVAEATGALPCSLTDALGVRYVDLSLSEDAWVAVERRGRRGDVLAVTA